MSKKLFYEVMDVLEYVYCNFDFIMKYEKRAFIKFGNFYYKPTGHDVTIHDRLRGFIGRVSEPITDDSTDIYYKVSILDMQKICEVAIYEGALYNLNQDDVLDEILPLEKGSEDLFFSFTLVEQIDLTLDDLIRCSHFMGNPELTVDLFWGTQ